MSLRQLPKINALSIDGVKWDAPSDAVGRWDAAVKGAADADTITIYDMVGSDGWSDGVTAKRVGAALRAIGSRDVTVLINSPGGDFFEGLAIYNLLREHPHKITVKVVGLAASAASIIAMAGDEIQVAKSGFIMIHNAWSLVIGNRHDLRSAADVMDQFDASMADLYSIAAGIDVKEAAQLMDAETWMNGQAAVDAGFATGLLPADEIIEEQDQKNSALAAKRRVDSLLAKQGMPRSERRALLEQIKGTHDAAPGATHDAGTDLVPDLLRAIAALRQ
ncbi:Clp protease ClpP [Pusillimonas sp. DMV24BSW_D]|uniref:head maturation protease, ClpP-related n=1 Tax=Neopusillimonas aestuarii TaxID=2716226 RepID=UPI00140E3576|nr:head maturation protease, ClpP-related [Pusillimonas sp. DMV24BSW_D]QIM48982.1 Clp protease ClpP [Pusillimonas sp. DMV24BSW_D]